MVNSNKKYEEVIFMPISKNVIKVHSKIKLLWARVKNFL